MRIEVLAPPEPTPAKAVEVGSAIVRFIVIGYVQIFFSGVDRAVFDGILHIDWLRQVYVLAGMLLFALAGDELRWRAIGPAAINLALIPFNTINPFITRIGFAFWTGATTEGRYDAQLRRAAAAGVIAGSVAVVVHGLYVTFVKVTSTFGAGFFLNPNFVVGAALGMPFLRHTRHPYGWGVLVVVACIFSGSNSAMIACLVAAGLTFGFAGWRVLAGGVVVATLFAVMFNTPLNYTYKTPNRILAVLDSTEARIESLLGLSVREHTVRTPADQFDSAIYDRAAGLDAMIAQGWRLLWPLSPVQANQVRHIGVELYIATYGLILCPVYLVLGYRALPIQVFLLLCVLLPLFTDPLLEFGIGLLALRSIWPSPSGRFSLPRLVRRAIPIPEH
jgi:hypothetical protein